MENNNTNEYYGGAMNERHITRFTYKFTNFQGWRVAISRQGITLARYFSDKQFGGEQESVAAALATRDKVLAALRRYPNDPARAFDECREDAPASLYPKGLRPRKGSAA